MPNLSKLNDKPLSGPIHSTLTAEDSAILACLPYTADIMIYAERRRSPHGCSGNIVWDCLMRTGEVESEQLTVRGKHWLNAFIGVDSNEAIDAAHELHVERQAREGVQSVNQNTVGHLATADGRVITNSVDAGADLDVVEARGAAVLAPGESYTVEVGADDTWARMTFFNDWFELTGFWPVGADHIATR